MEHLSTKDSDKLVWGRGGGGNGYLKAVGNKPRTSEMEKMCLAGGLQTGRDKPISVGSRS